VINKELAIAAKYQDSIASFETDSKLHNLILDAAGNVRAHRIINNLMGQIQRINFISGHKPVRILSTV
jgi:DNA-binding GntR family transcriptional regulator